MKTRPYYIKLDQASFSKCPRNIIIIRTIITTNTETYSYG